MASAAKHASYRAAKESSAAPMTTAGRAVHCQAAVDGAGAGAVAGAAAGEVVIVLGAAAGVADADAGVPTGVAAPEQEGMSAHLDNTVREAMT